MALRFWNFEFPLKSFGDQKKKLEKKGHKHHPKKKGTSTAFCAGSLTPKKRVGVEQEEAA
jgi:hypothetical protein